MADEPDDIEPDLLRERLLMLAEHGEITGKQAEAAAAAHGLEPFERKPELPCFDPKLKSHWSVMMVVAWIAWRDFELVRKQDPEFCSACFHWVGRVRKVRPQNDGEPVMRMVYSLEARRADFDKPVQRRYWEDWFDITVGPLARAYHLLQRIDLGPKRDSGRGPLLEFNVGSHPGDNTHYVNAKDMLSLSLLQARLVDLKLPIKIVEGE